MRTGIVLRAVAIVFIVSTHFKFFEWEGTAHVLMALAGYKLCPVPSVRRPQGAVARTKAYHRAESCF